MQFGGQTPLKIANALKENGVKIVGTSPESIDLAEDREKFGDILQSLSILCPKYGTGVTIEEVAAVAENIGYPGSRKAKLCFRRESNGNCVF